MDPTKVATATRCAKARKGGGSLWRIGRLLFKASKNSIRKRDEKEDLALLKSLVVCVNF